jgi:hypothetical protein
MVAAAGRSGWRMDASWVGKFGVEGFPAPHDRSEVYPLWVAKIYQRIDPSRVAKLPHDTTLCGADCPGCARRGAIPDDGWYYHPDSPEFAQHGSRVRPEQTKGTAWMHKSPICAQVWKDVHEWVRAHAEDVWMFDRCPAGQNAHQLPA